MNNNTKDRLFTMRMADRTYDALGILSQKYGVSRARVVEMTIHGVLIGEVSVPTVQVSEVDSKLSELIKESA